MAFRVVIGVALILSLTGCIGERLPPQTGAWTVTQIGGTGQPGGALTLHFGGGLNSTGSRVRVCAGREMVSDAGSWGVGGGVRFKPFHDGDGSCPSADSLAASRWRSFVQSCADRRCEYGGSEKMLTLTNDDRLQVILKPLGARSDG